MNVKRVTSLDADELSVYLGLNEKQLKRFYEPQIGLFICESEKVIRRALKAGYIAESYFVEEEKLDAVKSFCDENDTIYCTPYSVMKEITGYSLTGGILAAMRRKQLPELDSILKTNHKVVLLDDVENPTNVGAIFRSAAALGADAVLLTEGCSDPLYRRAARVSMGTVFQVEWTFIKKEQVKELQNAGFTLMALSLSDDAEELNRLSDVGEKRVVILGNEDHGISKEILDICDKNIIIPMKQEVDSLNVAAASAVAFWEIFK